MMRAMSVSALALAAALCACATPGSPEAGPVRQCDPAAGKALVGRSAPDDAAILASTHTATVRRLAPGDIATTEFRDDRITLTIEKGRVVAASCG